MRNEIGYGPTPEYLARFVVRVPATAEKPVRVPRKRAGYVASAPVEEAAKPFYRPDTRFSYRVREPGKKVRFGPPRSSPIR
jgi:hypothetical protein